MEQWTLDRKRKWGTRVRKRSWLLGGGREQGWLSEVSTSNPSTAPALLGRHFLLLYCFLNIFKVVSFSVRSLEHVSVCTALNHKNTVQRAIIFTVSTVAILYTLKQTFFPKTVISLCMSEVQLKSKKSSLLNYTAHELAVLQYISI